MKTELFKIGSTPVPTKDLGATPPIPVDQHWVHPDNRPKDGRPEGSTPTHPGDSKNWL